MSGGHLRGRIYRGQIVARPSLYYEEGIYMLHKEERGGRLSIKFRGTRNFINKLFRRAKRGE